MNLLKTYIIGHMGGECPSEPPRPGEMFFVGSVITLVVAVAFGLIGYIGYLIVSAVVAL